MMTKQEWLRHIERGRLYGGRLVSYESGERYESEIDDCTVTDTHLSLVLRDVKRGRGRDEEYTGPDTFTYLWSDLLSAHPEANGATFMAIGLGQVEITFSRP